MNERIHSMKRFFLLQLAVMALILPNTSVYSFEGEDDNEIVVPLVTGAKLLPIYLVHFNNQSQLYSQQYVKKLEAVLRFDLDQNGMSNVVDPNADLESLAKQSKFNGADSLAKWKKHYVNYVIAVDVMDKSVNAKVFSLQGGWNKEIGNISINGDEAVDRRQMHLIADTIHKILFGTEGIAQSKILYTLKNKVPGEKDWTSDVWEADYDGANARQVLTNAGYSVTPQYVPPAPGKRPGNFIFVSYKTGQPKIYLASLKDGATQRFTLLRGNQLMPTLSYQRDKMAFVSDVTGNPDLFVQSFSPTQGAIGKPWQIFAAHLSTQGTPTFSPDGKRIAFVSNKDGSPRIYVLDVPKEGTKIQDVKSTLITKFRRGCTAPAWSPDGGKVAYCARMDGVRQIYVYDFKTRKELQLTQGGLNKENPTWAPNSLHIIYNTSNDGATNLYLINLNHPKAQKITSGKGDKRFPSWEPQSIYADHN